MDSETKRIDIGDGRIVEVGEPDPPTTLFPPSGRVNSHKPKTRKAKRAPKKPPKRPKIIGYKQTLYNRKEPIYSKPTGRNTNPDPAVNRMRETIPGYHEWMRVRLAQIAAFRNKIGFGCWIRGGPDGMRRAWAKKLWGTARVRAKKDVENLEKAGLIASDDDIAKEATTKMLEIMRSPSSVDIRLKAATQLLTFYKAKPVQRVENKVDLAEAWLADIAKANNDEDAGGA